MILNIGGDDDEKEMEERDGGDGEGGVMRIEMKQSISSVSIYLPSV